jgi:hypothetical protein
MKRREFLLSGTFFLATAGTAFASQSEDEVTRRLHREGFRITQRKRTWLGRIKIQAKNGKKLREIVLDPTSGEVLRDYTEELSSQQSQSARRSNRRDDNNGGSSSGSDEQGGSSGGDSGSSGSGDGSGETGGGEPGGSETGSGGEPGGAKEETKERKGKKEERDAPK